MDLHTPIKKALSTAKASYEKKDYQRAAAAYEKASNLMRIHAEQAISREVELNRKRKAMEYREMAQRLRSGEGLAERAPEGRAADTPRASRRGAAPSSEIRNAVHQLIHHSSIKWSDIGGLEQTKQDIKLALGMSLATPPSGVIVSSWTNILFYGPPGTGKTLLAAATSNAVRSSEGVPSVFFNVKISSVLSKYFGESSRIISELYGTARDTSPAVIFLDEFESICARRGEGADAGPERRILSTILAELDGLEQKGRLDLYVLTIAATNRPWDLDPAILSRFEKKILIPLPDARAREQILRLHLEGRGFRTGIPYTILSEMTEGFSGRELERFSKEVTARMVAEMNRELPNLVDKGLEAVRRYAIKVRDLTMADFERAADLIHPLTAPQDTKRYSDWKESLGG